MNASSGAGLAVRALAVAVPPVSDDTADCPDDRVLSPVDVVGTVLGGGARVVVAGSKYSIGKSIQLVELWKVPRVNSTSMVSNLGTYTPSMLSSSFVAMRIKYSCDHT